MVPIQKIVCKRYRVYTASLLGMLCVGLLSLRALKNYQEALALKGVFLKHTQDYQRLKSLQPSLTRDNILAQRAHISSLEDWIASYLSRPVGSIETYALSSKAKAHTLDGDLCNRIKESLRAHSISLDDNFSLSLQPLRVDDQDLDKNMQLQSAAIATVFDYLVQAKPERVCAFKAYTDGAFKTKSVLCKAFSQDGYCVNKPVVGYFKIKFCGYSESLRSFIYLLHKSPYAFVIDRLSVRTKPARIDTCHGFCNTIPGVLEFSLWLALATDFPTKSEHL